MCRISVKRVVRTVSGLPAASLMLFSAGCGESNAGKGTIAVIVKSQGADYRDSLHLGANDAAAETGYEVYYDAPMTEADLNVQEDLIKKAIDMKVKAIVIAPLDAESLNDELSLANEAGIPVVCVDSDCTFSEKKVFIASNNTNAGSVEARHAGDILLEKGGGTVAVVGHSQTAGNIKGRVGGFIDTLVNTYGADVSALDSSVYVSADDVPLDKAVDIGRRTAEEKNYPAISIVSLQYTDLREDAARITEDLVDNYPDLTMIYVLQIRHQISGFRTVSGTRARREALSLWDSIRAMNILLCSPKR